MQRTDAETKDLNCNEAVKACRQFFGVNYTKDAKGRVVNDCDEFPFQSVKEGTLYAWGPTHTGTNFSVRALSLNSNRSAGALLGNDRILYCDTFQVRIVSL